MQVSWELAKSPRSWRAKQRFNQALFNPFPLVARSIQWAIDQQAEVPAGVVDVLEGRFEHGAVLSPARVGANPYAAPRCFLECAATRAGP